MCNPLDLEIAGNLCSNFSKNTNKSGKQKVIRINPRSTDFVTTICLHPLPPSKTPKPNCAKVNERAIIHEKHNYLRKNTLFNETQINTSLFPKHIHRTREPIRDLVDFSKKIHRTREPIRDLENSSFQELRNSTKVFPEKCRGIILLPFLYYLTK